MILLAHLLFGAVIASYIKNPILAIILTFLSHYLLDFIPHAEYPIKNISEKDWKKSLPDFLKILVDFTTGAVLIFIFSAKTPIIFICAFFAILPDGLTVLSAIFPNRFLAMHNFVHSKKIHVLKTKKISNFWRILSQAIIVMFSIILLKF